MQGLKIYLYSKKGEDKEMMDFINSCFNSSIFGQICFALGIILTLSFFFAYFSRSGRDEHGRGIMATAGFYAVITLLIIISLSSLRVSFFIQNRQVFMNYLQVVYNVVLLVVMIVYIVLRKIR